MKTRSEKSRSTVNSADDFARNAKRRLPINQIRDYAEQLIDLPDGAPLPDFSELTLGDRFAILLRLIPGDQWEQLLGKSKNHIRTYENGVDIPLPVVAALGAETRVGVDWVITGKGMDRPIYVEVKNSPPYDEAEDVPIQKLAFKAAAGRGELILDDLAAHVRFPRAILGHVGVTPQNARLWEASGESMRETIHDGDLLLVDVSPAATQIVEGKIYVFSIGNEAFVKRLRRLGDKTIMISDNREMFPEEVVPDHLPMRVYGRVKWTGRTL